MKNLFFGTGIAHTLMLIAFVVGVGLYLGRLKFKGISLGATWILFVGIFLSHFGFRADGEILHFVKEFGLILFVYSIGLSVGPGFFQSFKEGGVKLNLLSVGIVLLGCACAVGISLVSGESIQTMVGVMQGAVTNTPGLGAAQQTVSDTLPAEQAAEISARMSSAYAVAYPLGVIAAIMVLILIKNIFHIDTNKELADLEAKQSKVDSAVNLVCRVSKKDIIGKSIEDVDKMADFRLVISRVYRGDELIAPYAELRLQEGDMVKVVTASSSVEMVENLFGSHVELPKGYTEKRDTQMVSKRVIVSRRNINGKTLKDLHIRSSYGVSITRVIRSGVELVARPDLILQMGDSISVVGAKSGVEKVEKLMGNSSSGLNHPNLIPIFLGIAAGVLLGSIPFRIPGIPQPIKLGLAGGPLIVSILVGAFGPRLKVTTYTTTSSNLMLREIGISLFLAAVGLGAGENFVSSIVNGGYWWILYGLIITVVPPFIIAIIGRLFFKLNFFQICGMLSGSGTNPPLLAFAQNSYKSDYISLNYATVYPLSMFMRVLMAQMLILFA